MNNVELNDLILAASNYYNGRPTGMNDETYDRLLAQAKADDPSFNIFDKIVIGGDRENVTHYIPFTAQEFKLQFHSSDELKKLIEETGTKDWIMTPKWDGCSTRAYYKNGKLFDIVTRSDEYCGKRKYDQLKNKFPQVVDPRVICIDCEAVCSKEDYAEDTRSNANGLVNSCYKQEEVDKFLQLIPFKVTTSEVMTYLDAMHLVFSDEDIKTFDVNDVDFDVRFIEYKGKHYPIDGFVFYLDTEKNHKIYKHYYNQDVTTTVTDVEWNYTDKYCWVPKVVFDPIYIDGRRVCRATSNGFARLSSIKAGIGSEISVILANSTIPQVSKVVVQSEDYNIPTVCPFCGRPLVMENSKIRCQNDMCSQVVKSVVFEFIKNLTGRDVDWNTTTIDTLKSILDDFDMTGKTREDIINAAVNSVTIERFGKHSLLKNNLFDGYDRIINGEKSIDLVNCLSDNQWYSYKTHSDIIDECIRIANARI